MSSWIEFSLWLQRILANSWTLFPPAHAVTWWEHWYFSLFTLLFYYSGFSGQHGTAEGFDYSASCFLAVWRTVPCSSDSYSMCSFRSWRTFPLSGSHSVKIVSTICWPSSNLRCCIVSTHPGILLLIILHKEEAFQSPYLTCEKCFFFFDVSKWDITF